MVDMDSGKVREGGPSVLCGCTQVRCMTGVCKVGSPRPGPYGYMGFSCPMIGILPVARRRYFSLS